MNWSSSDLGTHPSDTRISCSIGVVLFFFRLSRDCISNSKRVPAVIMTMSIIGDSHQDGFPLSKANNRGSYHRASDARAHDPADRSCLALRPTLDMPGSWTFFRPSVSTKFQPHGRCN